MKKIICFLFFLLLFVDLNAQNQQNLTEIHCKHFFYGCPLGTPASNDLIIRDIYALSSNDITKFADWVAYKLTPDMLEGTPKTRNWKADPWLDENETLETNDYKDLSNANFDRGHQAPLADFKGSPYWEQSNFLSNITPQTAELNQGPWEKLEEFERILVKKYYLIYVITGPIYDKEMPPLPSADELHKVPSAYWKIIAVPDRGKTFKTASFILYQNTKRNDDFLKYITTVNEIEKKTGLNLFSGLDDKIEEKFENQNFSDWIKANSK